MSLPSKRWHWPTPFSACLEVPVLSGSMQWDKPRVEERAIHLGFEGAKGLHHLMRIFQSCEWEPVDLGRLTDGKHDGT